MTFYRLLFLTMASRWHGRETKDTPVWLDLDSDDAGAGPLDKDDAPYQGRSAPRSRIVSVQAARHSRLASRRPSKCVPSSYTTTSFSSFSSVDRDVSLEPPPPAQRRYASDNPGEDNTPVTPKCVGLHPSSVPCPHA